VESLRDKFVTGNWHIDKGDNEEEDGDFEDLEMKEKNNSKNNFEVASINEDIVQGKEGTTNVSSCVYEEFERKQTETLKRNGESKMQRSREEFGEDNDAVCIRHQGFRQGLYCRIRIDGIPSNFIETFNAKMPLIIGGLNPQETTCGFIRCRFKKHRWHRKILKCNDPLVFSIGWRRFQSIPVFSMEGPNGRHR